MTLSRNYHMAGRCGKYLNSNIFRVLELATYGQHHGFFTISVKPKKQTPKILIEPVLLFYFPHQFIYHLRGAALPYSALIQHYKWDNQPLRPPLQPPWLQPLTPHLHYRIYYGDGNAQNKRAVGLGLSEGIQSQFNMMHQGEKHDRLAGRRWFLMFDGK